MKNVKEEKECFKGMLQKYVKCPTLEGWNPCCH